jgi:hypothetical protein
MKSLFKIFLTAPQQSLRNKEFYTNFLSAKPPVLINNSCYAGVPKLKKFNHELHENTNNSANFQGTWYFFVRVCDGSCGPMLFCQAENPNSANYFAIFSSSIQN